MNRGVLYALGAYLCWGLLPIFWKALQAVPALEILAHRMVWALLVLLVLLGARRRWRWLGEALRSRRTLLTFLTTALLLSLNWYIYIWAVNAGHIVETSLGYFMNPLVNVLLGVLFLKERLRPAQLAAIAIAVAGVLYMTISYGALPWISLTLAFSFGLYGLLRKTAALGSLEGLSLETVLMFLPALAYLIYLESEGRGAFGHADLPTSLLLAGAGLATAVPLLLFASGARRITLTTLGLLQYLAPTLQFLLGVTLYGEALDHARVVGFCLIWLALVLYTVDSIRRARRPVEVVVPSS